MPDASAASAQAVLVVDDMENKFDVDCKVELGRRQTKNRFLAGFWETGVAAEITSPSRLAWWAEPFANFNLSRSEVLGVDGLSVCFIRGIFQNQMHES